MCQELWPARSSFKLCAVFLFIVLNAYFMGASFMKAATFFARAVHMHVSIWFALKTYSSHLVATLFWSSEEEDKNNTHKITSKPCQSLFLVKFSLRIIQTTGISYDQPFLFLFRIFHLQTPTKKKLKDFFPVCATCSQKNDNRTQDKIEINGRK